MTLNEIVYSIADKLQPFMSKDSNISLREIEYEIKVQRSLLIRNELNKKRTIDPNIVQDLGCVELELADKTECCVESLGCNILRTKLEIPKTIELHHKPSITRVGPIDKYNISYPLITLERSPYAGSGKYNKNLIFAIYDRNRIYLVSNNPTHKLLTKINIRGIFEDPREIRKFTTCDGQTCYNSDSDYPINSWMIAYLQDIIFNKFVNIVKMPVDIQTDGVDTQNNNVAEQ